MFAILRRTASLRRRFLSVFVLFCVGEIAFAADPPDGLLTDLLEHTETVWRDGFPTNVELEELPRAVERLQFAAVETARPSFSWIVRDSKSNVIQNSYQIQVFSQEAIQKAGDKIDETPPDVWDSGRVESSNSSSVLCGEELASDTVYAWRVKTWNNFGDVSPFSAFKKFKTGTDLDGFKISRYPTVREADSPIETKTIDAATTFFDFGRASFGQIVVRISSDSARTAVVRLGERVAKDGRVDRRPAGTTRFAEYRLNLSPGTQDYFVKNRPDQRNSTGAAVLIPDYIGEVLPFRYAEVVLDDPERVRIESATRLSAYYPFNESASRFHSNDDERLNAVWNLCRYSIKATSPFGYYIDGDRERIPYEGDALLNQLSHYAVDREYSLARRTQEYLLFHPTWPTEWILQSVQIAWFDYLYTGDARFVEKYYEDLKAKSFVALAEENGLVSIKKGKLTQSVVDSIHFKNGQIRDIVDWPHQGLAGNENAESGETDGFVFCDFNAVVNAYHFFALNSMKKFADVLGKTEDSAFFARQMEKVRQSYQDVFFDAKRGVYRDGEATDHASLHANMFPLCFGLVPSENVESVTNFVKSRGMRCSVYGSQFLLDAVYEGNEGDYGYERLTADDLRGWLNMIRVGSTISLEAWDDRYKPNQDWNHAWGAAPANIIPRRLVGVEPLAPAFEKIRIKPQIADLTEIVASVPSIRGSIDVEIQRNLEKKSRRTKITIPANVVAEVWLPASTPDSKSTVLTPEGDVPIENVFPNVERIGNFQKIPEVGSGIWLFDSAETN